MHAIWENLVKDEESDRISGWHENKLRDTKKRVQSGKERVIDWQDAKEELRKRFE